MIPDFTKIDWRRPGAAAPIRDKSTWKTPEGLTIKRSYGESDVAKLPLGVVGDSYSAGAGVAFDFDPLVIFGEITGHLGKLLSDGSDV